MHGAKWCLFMPLFFSFGLSANPISGLPAIDQRVIETYSSPLFPSDTVTNETTVLDGSGKPTQDRLGNRGTFRWHRYIGYSVLVGSITSAVVGSMVLKKYDNNEYPSRGLLYTHRALGITTGLLGISNSYLGSLNYKKLKHDKVGLRKRRIHRAMSTTASMGFLATTVLGVWAMLDYRNADSPKNVEISRIHRGMALATTGMTLATVIVIIW